MNCPNCRIIARRVIKDLVADITDRWGIKHAWREIDEDVMNDEIIPEWERIITSQICRCDRLNDKGV